MSGMVKEERGMPMSEFLVRFCDLKGLFIVKVFLQMYYLPPPSLSSLPLLLSLLPSSPPYSPGSMRGSDCFLNPAAAQRAATVLGIDHEDLGRDIFNPPRGASLRLSTLFGSPHSSSPTPSETSSIQGSPFSHGAGNRSASLDAFVIGLYDQAFNALVMLINRALQSPIGIKGRSTIHVLDAPGFQHRELAGAKDGASFDDLCMNYQQERLQMLFHDSTFTSEQDRYIQENINWMFSEVGDSPLPVIDAIDKHVPQVTRIPLPRIIMVPLPRINKSSINLG